MGKHEVPDMTNGEVIAAFAPYLGYDPEDLEHIVCIYITTDGMMGLRTTECTEHTKTICEIAATEIEFPPELTIIHGGNDD